MLEKGCYTWRHHSVLRFIRDTLQEIGHTFWIFYYDLADYNPSDIQKRPGLVLVNHDSKYIIVIELTAPFEQNLHNVHDRTLVRKCTGTGS